jgi:hypothetical protein
MLYLIKSFPKHSILVRWIYFIRFDYKYTVTCKIIKFSNLLFCLFVAPQYARGGRRPYPHITRTLQVENIRHSAYSPEAPSDYRLFLHLKKDCGVTKRQKTLRKTGWNAWRRPFSTRAYKRWYHDMTIALIYKVTKWRRSSLMQVPTCCNKGII